MTLRDQLNNIQLLDKAWHNIFSSKAKFKRKSSKGPDDISLQDFYDKEAIYIPTLFKDLASDKFKISPLKGIPIAKQEAGKYRLIAVSNVRERIVHKAILALIHPLLYQHIDTKVSYCGVKKTIWGKKEKEGLTTRKAFQKIKTHVKNKKHYVFKADVKGFYDNVPKRKFLNKIKKLLDDHSLIPLITTVAYFKLENAKAFTGPKAVLLPKRYVGISQGSALSQFFANIYLATFDTKMRQRYGDRFIRYIDDFIVFCDTKEEAREAKEYSKKLLMDEKLELASDPNKTKVASIKTDYAVFLGIRIDAKKLSYKKNKVATQKLIQEILDEHNPDLYRRYKSNKDKVKAMNYKIQGIGQYLSFYHTEDTYDEINKWISIKRKRKDFKILELLEKKNIKSIIPIKEWQSFFN